MTTELDYNTQVANCLRDLVFLKIDKTKLKYRGLSTEKLQGQTHDAWRIAFDLNGFDYNEFLKNYPENGHLKDVLNTEQ